MQHLEDTCTYKIGNKLFIFKNNLQFEIYTNDWYNSIIFTIKDGINTVFNEDSKYTVVHHYHIGWERLIINNKDGHKDLPFHHGTYRFLPPEIKIIEL